MNCSNCVSQRVCKMWDHVDFIARTISKPPYAMYETGGPEAQSQQQAAREQDIQCMLGKITARACRMYVDKTALQKT